MRILFLTNNWEVTEPLYSWLQEQGNDVFVSEDNINRSPYIRADLVVSYCYQHILYREVIEDYNGRCINLHNSYLPYGRGSNPLFWAVKDGGPIGVSIHWMVPEVDAGAVIAQTKMVVHPNSTFREVYEAQHELLQKLFKQYWKTIKDTVGSYHTQKDFEREKHVLTNGWDTKIGEVMR